MISLKNLVPRAYQESILKTAIKHNTLVVIPTGLGKTAVAISLAIHRLNKFPDSRALILAPTKPLCKQHVQSFIKNTTIPKENISLLTGQIKPEIRKELFQNSAINIATPQCVTGDAQIFSKKNGPITISKFFDKLDLKADNINGRPALSCTINEEVLGYSDGKINPVHAIKAWKSNSEEIIQIKTELKAELKTTPEHPLLTINLEGETIWKQAKFLKENDFIGIINNIDLEEERIDLYKLCKTNELRLKNKPSVEKLIKVLRSKGIKISEFSNYRKRGSFPLKRYLDLCIKYNIKLPDHLTVSNKTGASKPLKLCRKINPDLAYIIGAMLGDGHIGNRNSKHGKEVVYTDLDRPEISNIFREKVKKIFKILPKEDKRKGIIYYSTALATILDLLGVPKGNKTKKLRVPRFLFFESKEIIGSFISGLFNSDGNDNRVGISIHTSNRKFSKDLQWLLKRLGMVSSIFYRIQKRTTIRNKPVKSSEIYSVSISGRAQIEKFLKLCKPNKEKCKILLKNLQKTKRPYTRSKNIFPIANGLKSAYKEYRKNGGRTINEVLVAYLQKALSLNNLLIILPQLTERSKKAKELESLINLPIRWVRIKSIRKLKEIKTVYDLTIKDTHSFITNQLISHNTVESDLKNNRIDLKNVSLLVIDEAHRSRQRFANTIVTRIYNETAKNPRVLALTASPGSTREKIDEIMENLNLELVEIRTEHDEDVKKYIQERKIEWINVDLPLEFKKIKELIKSVSKNKIKKLKKFGITKPSSLINKKDLLDLQIRLRKEIKKRNMAAFYGISLVAQIIKLEHAVELSETQNMESLKKFLNKLKTEDTKAAKTIVSDASIIQAVKLVDKLVENKIKHPKLHKLIEIVINNFKLKKDSRVIVFANYRDTVRGIVKELNKVKEIKAIELLGQKEGITQKKQIETIKKFEEGVYNVMVTSSIGEEGLSISGSYLSVFFDHVSGLRRIQREGRVARTMPGKVIFLITKGTRDEAMYWKSKRDISKMTSTLKRMQSKQEKQINLKKF